MRTLNLTDMTDGRLLQSRECLEKGITFINTVRLTLGGCDVAEIGGCKIQSSGGIAGRKVRAG